MVAEKVEFCVTNTPGSRVMSAQAAQKQFTRPAHCGSIRISHAGLITQRGLSASQSQVTMYHNDPCRRQFLSAAPMVCEEDFLFVVTQLTTHISSQKTDR
jgi:hypothetical protein